DRRNANDLSVLVARSGTGAAKGEQNDQDRDQVVSRLLLLVVAECQASAHRRRPGAPGAQLCYQSRRHSHVGVQGPRCRGLWPPQPESAERYQCVHVLSTQSSQGGSIAGRRRLEARPQQRPDEGWKTPDADPPLVELRGRELPGGG